MLGLFKKKKTDSANKGYGGSVNLGILIFENTSEVIQAEKALKVAGCDIRVMGPPPEIQTGCDLVIEFLLIEELKILRILNNANVSPLQVVAQYAKAKTPGIRYTEFINWVFYDEFVRRLFFFNAMLYRSYLKIIFWPNLGVGSLF